MPLPRTPFQHPPLGCPIGVDENGKAIRIAPQWHGWFQQLNSTVILPLGGNANTQQGQFSANLTEQGGATVLASGTVQYRITGNFVSIYSTSALQGTSGNTDLELTGLPTIIQPAQSQIGLCVVTDGRGNVLALFAAGGATITFNTIQIVTAAVGGEISPAPGTFKNTGTKGLPVTFGSWSLTYPVT